MNVVTSPTEPASRRIAEGAVMKPAAVHVDLDGARHIFRLHGWQWKASSDPIYETGVPRALDAFDAAGVRATFFVIAEDFDDPAKAGLIREIVGRGHEIASHSLTHVPLRGLAEDRQRHELSESRNRIHKELGVAPAGFRAPFFSMDDTTLRLLDEIGYAYDSSMMPGRRARGLASVPDRPRQFDDLDLCELPLPGHSPLPFPFHPSYSLVLGVRYFKVGLARFVKTGAPLVLLFHLIDFAEPLAASTVSGWRQRLFTLSNIDGRRKLDACRRMLDQVRRSYTIADTDQLLELARHERKETSS